MKGFWLIIFVCVGVNLSFAQRDSLNVVNKYAEKEDVPEGPIPERPTWSLSIDSFIQSNLNTSKFDTVFFFKTLIGFIVTKEGLITNPKILKSSGNIEFDEEALRVVKILPNCKPAILNGKPIDFQVIIPILLEVVNEDSSIKKTNKK
jgi:TonB family protein